MKNEGEERDSGLLSSPLSFVRSGDFNWRVADLGYRGSWGDYWFSRSSSTTGSSSLDFDTNYLLTQSGYERGYGYAVRCVQILHRSH